MNVIEVFSLNMNFERFGIVFTISFVGYMLIAIILLRDSISDDSDIAILIISGLVLSIVAYTSQKKNPRKKLVITNRSYHIFFILGIPTGLGILIALNFAYGVDYQNTSPFNLTSGILLAVGGYAGSLFFTLMAMAVSVLNTRYIRTKISGIENTRWVPFIGGVTVGFGIMTVTNFIINGIPSLI